MKQRFLVPGLILAGLCLLGLGTTWSRLVPSKAYWGTEQALEYATAQADLHAISHSHAHDPEHEQQVTAAKERFKKSFQALEYSRTARHRTGTFLIAGGISLLLAGVVVHMAYSRPA